MFKKFCSVIALISFLLLSSMSASASEWCPIYDYSVNNLFDSIKNFAYEKNVSIYNIKRYTEKGNNYIVANFGDNQKNFVKFKINNDGKSQWATITTYWNKYDSTSKTIRSYLESTEKMIPIFLGIVTNIGVDRDTLENFSNKWNNKLDKLTDNMFEKIRNKQKIEDPL